MVAGGVLWGRGCPLPPLEGAVVNKFGWFIFIAVWSGVSVVVGLVMAMMVVVISFMM